MIKRLTIREKNIFILCVAMLCIYAVYSGGLKPMMMKMNTADHQIMLYEQRLNKGRAIIQKARRVDQQYARYRSAFRQSQTDEEVMAATLSEIERVASEFDLLITDLKPKRVKREAQYNQFSVNLHIHSDFMKIISFLHTLQRQPYFFNLTEAKLSRDARRNSKTITARLILSKALLTD